MSAERRLGAYLLGELLGKGGMGEVYRARDLKLGRDVAIKILPPAFASDSERVARFHREAKMVASLNHPNIGAIYGLEEATGVTALVLELVEGPTLADRIAQGPIPMEEALTIARQTANALEAAHEQGIVHRDLKPANIKITPSGTVKVLDFGLAKAFTESTGARAQGPTMTTAGTREGVVLGTPAYLSPEQARGRAVDKRTDVWGLGCVLYEMLTGRAAFGEATISDSIAAILSREPDWSVLPTATPQSVRRVLRRCLQKDVTLRLHDVADARLDLDETREDSSIGSGGGDARLVGRWRLGVLAATIATACVAGAFAWAIRGRAPESTAPLTSLSLLFDALEPDQFALSPDGSAIVFVGKDHRLDERLFIRRLDGLSVNPLPNTISAAHPTFSPDGRWIVFAQAGELKKISLDGGAPLPLTTLRRASQFDWSTRDNIVFTQLTDNGLAIFRVPAGGGRPQLLAAPASGESTDYVDPQLLPNGQALLFTRVDRDATGAHPRLMVLRLPDGVSQVIVENAFAGRFDGHTLLYVRGHTLTAIAFDPESLQTSGEARSIVDVRVDANRSPRNWALSGGTLAYAPYRKASDELIWVQRSGDPERIPVDAGAYDDPRVSPDGSRIALTVTTDGASNVWVYDVSHQTPSQLTHDGTSSDPVWTPDGRSLVYASRRSSPTAQIYRQPIDASGEPQLVVAGNGALDQLPCSWSAAGRHFVFWRSDPDVTRTGLWLLDTVSRVTRPVAPPSGGQYDGQLSPDGRWVAYLGQQGDQFVAFVTSTEAAGPKYQISKGAASELVWARGRQEIFYRSGSQMIGVTVRAGNHFDADRPVVLFSGEFVGASATSPGFVHYDVSPDAQRFVMIRRSPDVSPHLNVIRGFSDIRDVALR